MKILFCIVTATSLLIGTAITSRAQTLYVPSGTAGIAASPNTNVGIGITTPLEKLHINGSIRGSALGGALRINTEHGYTEIGPMNGAFSHFQTDMPYFYFNKSLHVNGQVSSYQTLNLQLQTNGTTRMTILNTNGYVGVGTVSPSYLFHVHGLDNPTIGIGTLNANTNGKSTLRFFAGNGTAANAFQIQYQKDASVDRLGFIDGGNVERVTINNGGNLGIGVTSPDFKVDVMNASAETEDFLRFRAFDAASDYLSISNRTPTAGQFKISQQQQVIERMQQNEKE